MAPPQTFQVNLDLPPVQRWQAIANTTVYWGNIWRLHSALATCTCFWSRSHTRAPPDTLQAVLSQTVLGVMESAAVVVYNRFPQPYKAEIDGIAQVTGVPLGSIVLLNMFYELSNHCTSIVAQDTAGHVLFARNQDLGWGMGFTALLRNQTIHVQFTRGGQVTHEAVTFAGYVGIPTGYVPDRFAVAIDTRFYNGSILQYAESVWSEFQQNDWHFSTWLV